MRLRSSLPSYFVLLLTVLHILGSDGAALQLGPFCNRAISNISTCPNIPTFDLVDATAYAGLWYGIGSTAQFKFMAEAGLSCIQHNYTVETSTDSSEGVTLSVVSSGLRNVGPVAIMGIAGISRGSKDVCESAREVCTLLGPPSDLMQSVSELCKIAYLLSDEHPDQADIITSVTKQVEGFAVNISRELPMLARHVKDIQIVDGYLNEANGTAKASVEQIRLDLTAISTHLDVIVEFVNEMAAARKNLTEVTLKLVMDGEFINSVDVTEASVLMAAAEQSILFNTKRIEESLRGMNVATELILGDTNNPNYRESWNIPGIANQNATSKGRLQFSIMGLSVPFWIIALEGFPRTGYRAGLVYCCTEDMVAGTIEQSFFVISRTPSIQPAILERFMGMVLSLGIDLDCENPFVSSNYNCE